MFSQQGAMSVVLSLTVLWPFLKPLPPSVLSHSQHDLLAVFFMSDLKPSIMHISLIEESEVVFSPCNLKIGLSIANS